MRVIMTGGSGLVGTALGGALRARGDEVTLLTARAGGTIAWDPLHGPAPREAFEGADAVVHLAGEPIAQRWTPAVREAIRASRTTGTANLVAGIGAAAQRPRILRQRKRGRLLRRPRRRAPDRGLGAGQRLPRGGLRRVGARGARRPRAGPARVRAAQRRRARPPRRRAREDAPAVSPRRRRPRRGRAPVRLVDRARGRRRPLSRRARRRALRRRVQRDRARRR